MEHSPGSPRSLPEPSVSEDGTICESINDTISRLGHENDATTGQEGPRKAAPPGGKRPESAPEDHKSGLVHASGNGPHVTAAGDHPEATTDDLLQQDTSDALTASDTPRIPGTAAEDRFAYNSHNEAIFDDFRYFPSLKPEHVSVVKFDAKDPDCISHATLKALVVQLTSPEVIDYNLICDFFLTYRTFTESHVVLNMLLTRLIWSLQYINSRKPETEKLGKLVLLRTFVVLRHWILNYFYDDFESDDRLCDLFSFHINHITESAIITPEMAFELKIFSDLKTHWLTQINEFFNGSFSSASVFATPLPMSAEYFDVKRLTKSNTEASIHTNPSFRRSAMLSLYDQKTHHKCIIYDGLVAGENGQLPISNLVNQHKSSRVSLDDKLKEYYTKGTKRENVKVAVSRREPLAPKHNYMNLKDSSLALKKTSSAAEKSVLPKDDMKAGFSTNGRVKLPSSRIHNIVPLSPVKKMRCSVKDDKMASDMDDMTRKKSIKRIVEGWTKSLYSPDLRSDKSTFSQEPAENFTQHPEPPASPRREIGDRVDVLSARIIDELEFVIRYYIFDSHQTITETDGNDEISRATIAFSPKKKVTDVLLPTALEKQRTHESGSSNKELSMQDLSELNIEKIDNLFSQSTIGNSEELSDSFGSQGRKSRTFSGNRRGSRGGSKRSSFGGRVTSINWNDDGNLFLEHSASLRSSSDTSPRPETKFYDVSADRIMGENGMEDGGKEDHGMMVSRSISEGHGVTEHHAMKEGVTEDHGIVENPPTEDARTSNSASQSGDPDSSDLDQYDAEVSELGIAMSPQSLKRKPVQRISLHEQLCSGSLGKGLSLSRNSSGSMAKHESVKSYVSYDSAFSGLSESSRNDRYSSHLKKKHGYHDLRKLAQDGNLHSSVFARLSASSNVSGNVSGNISRNSSGMRRITRASMASHLSRNSSARKSTRLSTLCALTELPFNSVRESYASMSTRALFQDESGKLSDLSVSSVFSNTVRDKQRESTEPNRMSSSVAIPGISNNILRELASIPDESFSSKNPIQFALFKLEGKQSGRRDSKTPRDESVHTFSFDVSHGNAIPQAGIEKAEEAEKRQENREHEVAPTKTVPESGPVLEKEAPHTPIPKNLPDFPENSDVHQNTEDILDEINNAVTEDAIGYSSDIEDELRQRPITPIKTRSKSTLPVISSSHTNAFYATLPTSESGSPYSLLNPKLVLDGYYLASDNLTVKHVMAAGSHVSFILSYDSKAIADHFTIIERDMLQEIDWKELIELKWNKDLTPVNSWLEIIVNDEYYNKNKGVNLVIARFNLVVNWIISEILLTKSEDERREIVSRFIHVAYHSYEMQNFSTLMQVVLALTSEKVNRLKSTWNNLSPGDILTLKHLEQVTSPLKNFINMRVGTNSVKPSKGCIPFVGLYLSDLVFNAERPKFVKTKKEPAKNTTDDSCELSVTQGDSTLGSDPGETEKMINFARFRTAVHIVKSLSQSIEWSQNYNVAVDDELLRKCLYIKSLDEGEMNFCLEQLNT